MKVRSYGKLADLLGPEREIDVQEAWTVGDLRAHLAAQYPEAAAPLLSKRFRACAGGCVVPDSHLIVPTESLELLAPVSGG